jgi:hypothetical protein
MLNAETAVTKETRSILIVQSATLRIMNVISHFLLSGKSTDIKDLLDKWNNAFQVLENMTKRLHMPKHMSRHFPSVLMTEFDNRSIRNTVISGHHLFSVVSLVALRTVDVVADFSLNGEVTSSTNGKKISKCW